MHVWSGIGVRLVLRISLRVLLSRNRVIGIAFSLRKFINDAGLAMLLPGEIFEFRDARVELLVGVINHGRRLVNRAVVRFVFEFQRAIGKLAKTIFEIS